MPKVYEVKAVDIKKPNEWKWLESLNVVLNKATDIHKL